MNWLLLYGIVHMLLWHLLPQCPPPVSFKAAVQNRVLPNLIRLWSQASVLQEPLSLSWLSRRPCLLLRSDAWSWVLCFPAGFPSIYHAFFFFFMQSVPSGSPTYRRPLWSKTLEMHVTHPVARREKVCSLSRRPWFSLGRSCWPCSSMSIAGIKGILPESRAADWKPRESQLRLLEYIKGGQMLSKYSIKKGGQVISKANSVPKWSGWYTHSHPISFRTT